RGGLPDTPRRPPSFLGPLFRPRKRLLPSAPSPQTPGGGTTPPPPGRPAVFHPDPPPRSPPPGRGPGARTAAPPVPPPPGGRRGAGRGATRKPHPADPPDPRSVREPDRRGRVPPRLARAAAALRPSRAARAAVA